MAPRSSGDLVVASNEIPESPRSPPGERIGDRPLSALGVPLRATFRPPPEIPDQPKQVYFIIDTSDQLWQELVAERKIAIFIRAPPTTRSGPAAGSSPSLPGISERCRPITGCAPRSPRRSR
jgi:hypothetical protein